MKPGPRPLGTLGFIFSAITVAALLPIPPIMVAFVTYPISIIVRAIAWILTGLKTGKFHIATGAAVGILGSIFYLLITVSGGLIGKAEHLIFLWMIYSTFEFISYIKLKGATRTFLGASVNIVGIILAYPLIIIHKSYHPVLIPLLISAIMAAISFYKMKMPATH